MVGYHRTWYKATLTYVVLLTVVVQSNVSPYLGAPELKDGHADTAPCHVEATDGGIVRAIHHFTDKFPHTCEVAG